MDFNMNKWNAMIIGGAPKHISTTHSSNDNGDAAANNNDANNVSLSYAITSYDAFLENDNDDVDCLNDTKNDMNTLANKCISSNIEFNENDNIFSGNSRSECIYRMHEKFNRHSTIIFYY